jgi:hypothetical protein
MYRNRSVTPTTAISCREAKWTSKTAKLAPKPHQYKVLHPSALLPFDSSSFPLFDLLIVSRDLRRLFAT